MSANSKKTRRKQKTFFSFLCEEKTPPFPSLRFLLETQVIKFRCAITRNKVAGGRGRDGGRLLGAFPPLLLSVSLPPERSLYVVQDRRNEGGRKTLSSLPT